MPRRTPFSQRAVLTGTRITDTFVWVALGACAVVVWFFGLIGVLFAPRGRHASTS